MDNDNDKKYKIYINHIGNCKVCQEELDDELCIVGNILYYEATGENYSDEKYKKYVLHIIECKECQKGLEMDSFNIQLLKDTYIHNIPVECECDGERDLND